MGVDLGGRELRPARLDDVGAADGDLGLARLADRGFTSVSTIRRFESEADPCRPQKLAGAPARVSATRGADTSVRSDWAPW